MKDLFRISNDNESYFKELKLNLEKVQFENTRLRVELEKTVKHLLEQK